jgi:UDP-N-acetyl-2-amino-2-deoxyglucuronate dehydrogenase
MAEMCMSDELRVGLVGCGAMGQGHLHVWQEMEGVRVAAVCDGLADRAKETAAAIGATPFTTVEEMASSGLIDAVDIVTPSGFHCDQGIIAARNNLHVLCEKPLDLNIEKADLLVAECEARGLTLAVVFQQRGYPGTQHVKRDIEDGKLGRLLSCSAHVKWWRKQAYYDSAAWRGTWALDCGVLSNQAIHSIDLMCWFAGPVAEVEYAYLDTALHTMEAEDFAIAVLRFENGARGVIEATTCCYPDLCTRVEIVGSRGSAALEDANVITFGYDGEDRLATIDAEAREAGGGRSDPQNITLYGHQQMLADFASAVKERRKPIVSGRDARISVDALNKIYRRMYPNQKLGT